MVVVEWTPAFNGTNQAMLEARETTLEDESRSRILFTLVQFVGERYQRGARG